MTIKEAFKKYKNGDLLDFEIRKFIREATNDCEPEQLKTVKKKLESYKFSIRRKINGNPEEIITSGGFPLSSNIFEIREKYFSKDESELRKIYDRMANELGERTRSFEVDNLIRRWGKEGVNFEGEERKMAYIYFIAIFHLLKDYGEATIFAIFDLMKLKELDKLLKELLHSSIEENKEIGVTKKTITREYIFEYCKSLKEDGMTVVNMFEKVENLLLTELNFTREEIKERFNFSLNEPYHFNKFLNNHI